MALRLEFKPSVIPHIVDDELMVFITESGCIPLESRLYPRLTPLIDGSRDLGEIIACFDGDAAISPLDVIYGLSALEDAGYLAAAPASHSLPPPPEPAAGRPPRQGLAAIAVDQVGDLGGGGFAASLAATVAIDPRASLRVVLTDDYLREAIGPLTQDGRPSLLVRPLGDVVWVGPVLGNDTGLCHRCLAHRLTEVWSAHNLDPQLVAAGLPYARLAARAANRSDPDFLLQEVAAWVAAPDQWPAAGVLRTAARPGIEWCEHPVVPLPWCPTCGPHQRLPRAPLRLTSRAKVSRDDGGHRAAAATATWQKFSRFISPLTGIVHSVEPPGLGNDGPVRLFVARHNFRVDTDDRGVSNPRLRKSMGKGVGQDQARVSALCEALERYSGVFRGDEAIRTASYRELGDQAIHPDSYLGFSEQQYRNRDRWNRLGVPQMWIPQRFREDASTRWVSARSLADGQPRQVPAAFAFYGYVDGEHDFCRADSNGNASGCSPEDAVLQGLLELIERDGVALWWYSSARRPAVELESFGEAFPAELAVHYRSLGRECWVLDLTADLGIPTFAAVSRSRSASDYSLGFGAHLDPNIAICRALTEMNQGLPMLQAGGSLELWVGAAIDPTFLCPDPDQPPRVQADYTDLSSDDLREDIHTCTRRLDGVGIEPFMIDLTRAEIGLATVKILAPGLRHFWPRFAPGRLYDVPAKLGWSDRVLTERDLNSAHLVI